MPNPADNLRAIKTFEDLLPYLQDELDWPLEEYDFEDLTFEYSPAELGLREEQAAKVKTIHQLRPLRAGQPWGIFFVEFDNRRMPVVVLRRILSHLVIKKRAAANRAQSAAWNLHDLLFISAFGSEASDQREIAFAHFQQSAGDLPTLRVLGWDGADTGLKLDYVAATLQQRLRWPANPADDTAWRAQWSAAFRHRPGHEIKTADELAQRLAGLARATRFAASTLMAHETEHGPLRRLHKAFQTALIHDLSEEDFADTYAQTVTYGLLTAAIQRTDLSGGQHDTTLYADMLAEVIPITNPFLREMLQTFLQAGGRQGGIDFDELGIQDVVELLRGEETDLPAILRDFGNKTRGEDPVIHFYEHFLAAYDKALKVKRGIFYTPQPVVSYIVRSVHQLLQDEFLLSDGLASESSWAEVAAYMPDLKIPDGIDPDSHFVTILDPATGTATFLVEVIEVIHKTLMAKWRRQGLSEAQRGAAWNTYVPQHLLPRLYGYELMMAPYAIAHMKIGLKLHETGYRFDSPERVRIFLTNALEPASDEGGQLAFIGWTPALAHEAQAVNAVKRHQRFTVVIGNPPYSGHSANKGAWIGGLVRDYYQVDGQPLGERNPKWLQDDYVKFFRLGQHTIAQAGVGVLSMITNHSYLDNPTFRGMRQQLMQSFPDIKVLDLHGNAKKKETAEDGSKDENVFDIQQGVAICVMVRRPYAHSVERMHHADLFGLRAVKYQALRTAKVEDMEWRYVDVDKPYYLLVPQETDRRAEYEQGWKITDIFPVNSVGIVTARDSLTIGWTEDEVWERVVNFASMPEDVARLYYSLGPDARDWKVKLAQEDIFRSGPTRANVTPILYRPFDVRFTYYTGQTRGFICMPRPEVMKHLQSTTNLALIVPRRVESQGDWQHVFIANNLVEHVAVSLKTIDLVMPLYVYSGQLPPRNQQISIFDRADLVVDIDREANIAPSVIMEIAYATGLQFQTIGDESGKTFQPEDIIRYVYAILHSPTYRTRYAEFLKIDFPRVPLTSSLDLFRDLAALGGELVALHLMESPALIVPMALYEGPEWPRVEKVSYADETIWLDKAQSYGFAGVPEAVWNFRIGGYQVCEKWLKDRGPKKGQPGRLLSRADIIHYQQIIVALHQTIRVMGEIDALIDAHGGWPIT